MVLENLGCSDTSINFYLKKCHILNCVIIHYRKILRGKYGYIFRNWCLKFPFFLNTGLAQIKIIKRAQFQTAQFKNIKRAQFMTQYKFNKLTQTCWKCLAIATRFRLIISRQPQIQTPVCSKPEIYIIHLLIFWDAVYPLCSKIYF